MRTLALALRFAARELRAGLSGFYIFLACLALGVGAISAAGSAAAMFSRGLESELGALLGGDVQARASRRRLDGEGRAALEEFGRVSEQIAVNAMASAGEGPRRLVEARGVDSAYPLYGAVALMGASDLSVLERRGGVWGAAASPALMTAFGLETGDRLEVSGAVFEVRAVAESVPDDSGLGFDFAPRLTVALAALEEAGLAEPGSLYTARYRIALAPEAGLDETKAALEDRLGEDWTVTTRREVGDQFDELLGYIAQFLAVAGLAALIAGGMGVNQAVSAFLETRIETIASLKTLGAGQGLVFMTYFIQTGALALLGSAAGAAVGAAAPAALIAMFADSLPLPAETGFHPRPALLAVAFGMMAALAFALPALGRARATPPAALIGGRVAGRARTPWAERIAAAAVFAMFAGLAVAASPSPRLAAWLFGAAIAAFVILAGAAYGMKRLAGLAAKTARGRTRLVLSSLAGPDSVAASAAPALGLGLALLAAITLIQTNLVRQLRETAPSNAPSLVITRIPGAQAETIDDLAREAGVAVEDSRRYRRAPFLFARITGIEGTPAGEAGVARSEQWIVNNEIAVSILADEPPEAVLTQGEWWPADYGGPPLISVEDDAARGMGVTVGDTLTLRVLGRAFEAEIANLRDIDWGGFGVNTAIVFAPGTLEGADPAHTAIIRADEAAEDRLARAVARTAPDALVIDVRAQLASAADIFEKASRAVTLVAGVVVLAGALVMLGAFAAAARRRAPQAALLKTLGVTPAGVLGLYAAEFALVGAIAAGLGAAFAAALAWPVVTLAFEAVWGPDWGAAAAAGGLAIAAAALGGALTGRAALSTPAARALRSR